MPVLTSEKIERLEKESMERNKELRQLRLALPRFEIQDYSFRDSANRAVKLSRLFGKFQYLVLIHNMGQKCKYCTMWANGFEGIYHHFKDKAAFVVVNHDTPIRQKRFASKMGWSFKMVSAIDNHFSSDVGFASDKNDPWPGVSTLGKKKDGKIELIAQAGFGPGDNYCAVWHLYDLLPEEYKY